MYPGTFVTFIKIEGYNLNCLCFQRMSKQCCCCKKNLKKLSTKWQIWPMKNNSWNILLCSYSVRLRLLVRNVVRNFSDVLIEMLRFEARSLIFRRSKSPPSPKKKVNVRTQTPILLCGNKNVDTLRYENYGRSNFNKNFKITVEF